MNRRTCGTQYEERAAKILEQRGYRIVARNYRCKKGEIDLIARCGEYLVFVEVKYRSTDADGSAAEAVNLRKQQRIIGAAKWYLMEQHLPQTQPCRFDVVAFDKDRVQVIPDAFWS